MATLTLLKSVNRDVRTQLELDPWDSSLKSARGRSLPWADPSVLVPGLTRDIEVKVATTRAEWQEAFQLVADSYQARGYDTGDKDFRFTSYHALPDTVTFVAQEQEAGRVVGTLSLVMDNRLLGLPMESIYAPEVQALRRQGRCLGEVVSLADDGLTLSEFVPVFLQLRRLLMQFFVRQGGDTWVFTVNPRHRAFYRKTMGCCRLGDCRVYPTVRNHPAEAFYLDVPLLKANAPDMYQKVFGERLAAGVLTAPRMPTDLVRHFGSNSSQTNSRHVEEILRYVREWGSPRRW